MWETTVQELARFRMKSYHPGKCIQNAQNICVMDLFVLRIYISLSSVHVYDFGIGIPITAIGKRLYYIEAKYVYGS